MRLLFLIQCLQDPTLGTRVEAGWIWIFHYVKSAYRHPSVFIALQVVHWLVPRCDTQYGQVPLHTSPFARLVAEILVTHRTALPGS